MNEALISKFSSLNLCLLTGFPDPFFTISHPTSIQTSLFAGATLAKFDPSGRFVAAARLTAIEIWDLETRAPIRSLDGHVKTITSIEYVALPRSIVNYPLKMHS